MAATDSQKAVRLSWTKAVAELHKSTEAHAASMCISGRVH